METKILGKGLDRLSRQRNLFMLLSLMLAASLVFSSLALFKINQRIIMVPGLNREIGISENDVSAAYLEEVSLLFLSHLLDITSNDIKYKRDLVLKYTAHSDPNYSKQINEYFAAAEASYKRFDLSTHFTVKNLQVNQKKLQIIANGILTSWYGKKGHEAKEMSYMMSFEYKGGFLRLKEFKQIIETKNGERVLDNNG